jgi:hypothetical protein
MWLCPAGLKEDFLRISHDIPEVLHVYLPPKPFSMLEGASETVTDGCEPAPKVDQVYRVSSEPNQHVAASAGVHNGRLFTVCAYACAFDGLGEA